MQDEEQKEQRDDLRCDAALQTIEDVLWRFNESNEGTLSAYDVIGYLVEDLVTSGFCAACIRETVPYLEDDQYIYPYLQSAADLCAAAPSPPPRAWICCRRSAPHDAGAPIASDPR